MSTGQQGHGWQRAIVATETRAGAPFVVRLPGPLDIAASLELFRRSGDDLIDRWDGATLVRTLPLGGRLIAYACTHSGTIAEPELHVTVADTADPAEVAALAEAVAEMFVPAPAEFAELVTRDRVIAQLNARYPGLRPVRQFELFGALVRCISAQQVNLRWAATTRARLAEAFGARHQVTCHVVYSLEPARFAALSVEAIRALQLTTRKAEYIISAAEAIASGRLSLLQLAQMSDEEVITALAGLRGIGRWSAEWILARTLGRPRVVAGDLAVRKAVGAAYLGMPPKGPLPSEEAVRAATAHWGPSAGVAQQLLLQGYGSGTLAT
jgi:DNA-3-methyladenine glycosylase II